VVIGDRLAERVAGALLLVALAFGGGSRGIGDAVVVLAALPVVVFACARWSWRRTPLLQRSFMLVLVAAVAWHLVQLVPLPAGAFAMLPMRSGALADLRMAAAVPSWLPATLDVWGTVRSLVALVVFSALCSLLSTLPSRSRLRLMKLVVVAGCAMALLGYAQAAAGTLSPLRPYEYHHAIGAIGTFANRNHFASLMAMLVPISLALAAQNGKGKPAEAATWYCGAIMFLLAAGLSFSRTGFVLACAAALTGLLATRRRGGRKILGAAFAVLAGASAVSIYAWNGLSSRLQQDPLKDLRWQYLTYGWEATKAYFPWGSGPGSFRYMYAPFEPLGKMLEVYALHAHNDLIEVAAESGLPGMLLISAAIAVLIVAVRNKLIVGSSASPILVASVVALVVLIVVLLPCPS